MQGAARLQNDEGDRLKTRDFQTLDGMRGVAALAVFILHAPGRAYAVESAYLAVDLFFVLSGFVLAHSYGERLRNTMSWAEFARLRIIRLYPLYALGTALGLGVAIVNLASTENAGGSNITSILTAAAWNLAFLPAWFSGQTILLPFPSNILAPYPFDFPLWSIFWELLVSLIFAALAPRLGNRGLAALLAACAVVLAGLALTNAGLNTGAWFSNFAAGGARLLYSFFAGVAVYRIWRSGRWPWLRAPSWAVMALLVVLLAARAPEGLPRGLYDAVVTLFVFPVLVLAATGKPADWISPWCARLGGASFAFYVLHMPAILWLDHVLANSTKTTLFDFHWPAVLALGGAIFLAALAIDRFYDQPTRAFLVRTVRRRAARAPAIV